MITDRQLGEIKTPAYIFDIDVLGSRIKMIREHLGDKIRVVYAIKANPFLVRPLIPLVDAFEVCSPGEEEICRRAGVPGKMLVLSGVNKEKANFDEIMDRYGTDPVYTVESELQMEMLSGLAVEKGIHIRVYLRLSGGSQFGMDESVLRKITRDPGRFPNLLISGLHYFTGTQKKPKRIQRELEKIDGLLEDPGFTGEGGMSELEYGPGLAVSYFPGEHEPDEEGALADLRTWLDHLRYRGRITLEMGRFIAASCGSYATAVADLKENDGTRYCIVDGGIHQVNYYGQNMAMKIPGIRVLRRDGEGFVGPAPAAEDTAGCTVCGSLCTTADVLVREWPAPKLQIHDILVFEKTGAYAVTEGISLFLSRDLPRIYLSEGDCLSMIRDKIKTEGLNDGTFN